MSPKSWKEGFLSSSLPLEFEVAKLLVKQGFSVDADYSYGRYDTNILKDFSVDIHATYFPAHKAVFHLLIECKYRTPNKKWLFLPDPNTNEFSHITIGYTTRVVDEFSPYTFGDKATRNLEAGLPVSYKATEINLSDGSVYDSDIKHGISQLRYALPRLLKDEILENLHGALDDNIPFIFCPILVTTAELFLMNNKMSLAKVAKASKIEELGKKVPYLILHSDYGPDFESHCRSREFVDLAQVIPDLGRNEQVKYIEQKRLAWAHKSQSPLYILERIVALDRNYMTPFFTQFFVTDYAGLSALIEDLKKSVSRMVKTRKKI